MSHFGLAKMVPTTQALKSVLCPVSPSLGHVARAAALSPRSLLGDTCHHQSKHRELPGCFLPFSWWMMAWASRHTWPVGPTSTRPPSPSTPAPVVALPKAPAPTQEHPTHSPWCKGRSELAGACPGDTTTFLCPSITTNLVLVLPGLGPTWWILHGAKEMGQFTVSLGWAVPKAWGGGFRVTTKHKGLE